MNRITRTAVRFLSFVMLAALLALDAWAADPNPAAGGVISINFSDSGDASTILTAGTAAGVVSRANWNNIQYNANTFGVTPTDDAGTPLVGTLVNCRQPSSYPGKHGYTSTVGNDFLMKAHFGTDEAFQPTTGPLIRVSGLPASFTDNGYSIYVYSDFNGNNDPHKFDLGTSILDAANPGAGWTGAIRATIFKRDTGANWPGSGAGIFTEGSGAVAPGSQGNYVVFRNETAGEFAIRPYCYSPARVAINGIQIVQQVQVSTNLTGSVLIVR